MRTTKKAGKIKSYLQIMLIMIAIAILLLIGFNYKEAELYIINIFGFKSSKSMNAVATESEIAKYDKYYKPMGFKSVGNLDKDILNWILLKEGGLTDNQNDSASKNPVGVTYTVTRNGKPYTSSKWHTNKGVTWDTLTSVGPKVGIAVDPQIFFTMPDENVFKIFKYMYADVYKENSGSALIDYMGALWAWGSGIGGEKALLKQFEKGNKKTLNQMFKEDKVLLFDLLVLYRIKFYERLVVKKPQNKVFLAGWIKTELNFYREFKKYL